MKKCRVLNGMKSGLYFGICLSALANTKPSVTLLSPYSQTLPTGAKVIVSATANDADGDLVQHWLEIKRPAGDWNWEGWLISEPFAGQVTGSGFLSSKSGSFTLTDTGTYRFRTTALDYFHSSPAEDWSISAEVPVTVVTPTTYNSLPTVSLTSPGAQTVAANTSLTITGTATDVNGTMSEHWLEVRRPAGDWSWEGWLTSEPWGSQLSGDSYGSVKSTSFTLTDTGTYRFRTTAYDPQFSEWVISNEVDVQVGSSTTYSTPSYQPSYWNDSGTVQYNNNCYNYSNNRRTDTFAQPGRASGNMYSSLTASEVGDGASSDGLIPTTSSGSSSSGMTKTALVIWPNYDYHWYRQDSNGMWTHKPGGTQATNLDNSGQVITNPETADRGGYTIFAGYYFTPSDSTQGAGHANIN